MCGLSSGVMGFLLSPKSTMLCWRIRLCLFVKFAIIVKAFGIPVRHPVDCTSPQYARIG
jgi:hypothetical protein